jgi:hypothetical protein
MEMSTFQFSARAFGFEGRYDGAESSSAMRLRRQKLRKPIAPPDRLGAITIDCIVNDALRRRLE